MRWLLRQAASLSVEELAQQLNIPPLLSRLLLLRGVSDPETAARFLSPRLEHLYDPFEMRGMHDAVRRIYQAIERREKVLIYGDYDVDGALAVVVLRMALMLAGADVHHHIPHRLHDGYGMREQVIEQAREQQYSLIISVDTGIRAFPVVERARELGLDCIITDHHLPLSSPDNAGREAPSNVIPQAHAVLNPKQANCSYPDKNLCGVGVAFKLAQALLQTHPEHSRRIALLLPSFLKLVCIGTIADNVPLVGENRVIARLGLEGLARPVNHGLKALIEAAGLSGKAITATDVGFRLAPRLNAAGRMESAQDIIDLFTADTAGAQQLALKLNRLNAERQKAEQEILAEIETRQRKHPEGFAEQCLVLQGEGWHRGVIGIVASRIMDRFNRPTLVLSCEDGTAHGSGRSFENFPLLEALTACGDLFERFGGHAYAAGFVLPVDRIAELRQRLNGFAAARLGPETIEPKLAIDAEISFADLSPKLFEELERLGPHGCGNPQPVFAAREIKVCSQPRLLKEKHLKFQAGQNGRILDAIGWRKAAWLDRLAAPGSSLDLAFNLSLNDYQNQSTIQLELLDMLPGTAKS